jgi:hypothetical protein
MGLDTPDVPSVFMKPANSLGDPYPAPTVIPAQFVKDEAADYEAEVALVIGKAAKNVSEEEAMDYLLGYVLIEKGRTCTDSIDIPQPMTCLLDSLSLLSPSGVTRSRLMELVPSDPPC